MTDDRYAPGAGSRPWESGDCVFPHAPYRLLCHAIRGYLLRVRGHTLDWSASRQSKCCSASAARRSTLAYP